jgi:capsular polysaccharide transport system permease protein
MVEPRRATVLGYVGENPPFVEALRTQLRVIGAIMLREMMTKFGRENLGFFWLMGEPLLLAAGVMLMWTLLGRQERNVSIVAFVLSGYSLLTLWRYIINNSVRCFRNNAGLLFHRSINLLDIVIARALLEVTGVGIAFFVAYILLYLLNLIGPIDDPLVLCGAWFLTAWFSFSVGLILAGLSEIWEIVERLVQPIMYVILPISGMFFMVEWLPPSVQKLAEYSVLVNGFEMFRGGLLGEKVIGTHWSVPYMVGWCIVLTAVGLFVVEKARASFRFE